MPLQALVTDQGCHCLCSVWPFIPFRGRSLGMVVGLGHCCGSAWIYRDQCQGRIDSCKAGFQTYDINASDNWYGPKEVLLLMD